MEPLLAAPDPVITQSLSPSSSDRSQLEIARTVSCEPDANLGADCHNRLHRISISYRQIDAALLERCQHAFGRDISDQRVLREWTAAQPADGGIKSATAGVVS